MKTPRSRNITRLLGVSCGFFMIVFFAHQALGKENHRKPPSKRTLDPYPSHLEKRFFEETQKYLGCRYQSGGSSSSGFDCSGFVSHIYKTIFDVDLPRKSSEQHQMPYFGKVSSDSLNTGDLVFFSSGKKKNRITHVGIYLSDAEFISATRKGVVISSLDSPYWKARYVTARRILNNRVLPQEDPQESTTALSYAINEKSLFSLLFTEAELSRFSISGLGYIPGGEFRESYRGIALGYALELSEQSWTTHVIAFRDYYFSRERDLIYALDRDGEETRSSQDFLAAPYVEGIKISSNIRPSDWLSINPSVIYFANMHRMDEADLPKLLLGLDVVLASSEDGWSLSTGLQYPVRELSSSYLFNAWGERSFDLSLTYRQWLTSQMQLTLAGEHLMKLSSGSEINSSRFERDEGRFSLMLNFFY